MEHQSFIKMRREGNGQKCASMFTLQNLNVYDLLTLQFRQSATLNIMIINNRARGRNMRMKFIVLYSVHQRLPWSRGSVLAFSNQVRGFKPG